MKQETNNDFNAELLAALEDSDDNLRTQRMRERLQEWEKRAENLQSNGNVSQETWDKRYDF